MTMNANDTRDLDFEISQKAPQGWTGLHSWIFLLIVAVGSGLIVMQNRFHYLDPQGLGKAYRIDKLFGSIQEFDPTIGWISARLAPTPGAAPTVEPSAVPSRAVPMKLPDAQQPGEVLPPGVPPAVPQPAPMTEKEDSAAVAREEPPALAEENLPKPPPAPPAEEKLEMSQDDRMKLFLGKYPDYGEEEFQLANGDLFPNWRKNLAPQGTWPEFMVVYGEFIQWWIDSGSPPEPGFKLWQDFIATKRR